VKASAFLALVHCAVLAVKARLSTVHVSSLEEQIERDEQLLDAATDAAEELEAALAVLNHAHPGHSSASVAWLHSTAIQPLSTLLSQKQSYLKRMLSSCDTQPRASSWEE
ncbi:unnamed protein product, partial [Closterium sp. NIES-53]